MGREAEIVWEHTTCTWIFECCIIPKRFGDLTCSDCIDLVLIAESRDSSFAQLDSIFCDASRLGLLLGCHILSGREGSQDQIDLVWSREVWMQSGYLREDTMRKVKKSVPTDIVTDILYQIEPEPARIAGRMSHIEYLHEGRRWHELRMETSIFPACNILSISPSRTI